MNERELRIPGGAVRIGAAGVTVRGDGGPSWRLAPPLKAQILQPRGGTVWASAAYQSIVQEGPEVLATGLLTIPGGGALRFEDRWSTSGPSVRVRRDVVVEDGGTGQGFLSAFELVATDAAGIVDVQPFVPAFMYGDSDLLPDDAVGSRRHGEAGVTDFMIREDAMPAPLVALTDAAGSGLVLFHCDPAGGTNQADASDLTGHTLVDRDFEFASLGIREADDGLRVGFWFPGTEGGAMRVWHDPMKRRFKPHNWRGRYHPLEPGVGHGYELGLQIGRHEDFPSFIRWAWRAVFDALAPPVAHEDLDAVESCIISHFAENIEERPNGVEHPQWLAWCRGFGEWLLTQQRGSGSFPRWWTLNGDVLDISPTGTFNAIPFLCELAEVSDERQFLQAAVRAGEYLWESGHSEGAFVGGTIDNPDLLDKEAASISMEAYLALHRATGDDRWLDAARVAADVTETWMYVWNVPMPIDADPAALDWKPGATTVGLSCVAVGGSGGDEYLAFNVAEFARLYELTGNPHYWRIARILLHNTKAMLATCGREYDLMGPGWQQEHWSMSLNRGRGAHRYWLPWVTVCHLTGMARLQDESPDLWEKAMSEILDGD